MKKSVVVVRPMLASGSHVHADRPRTLKTGQPLFFGSDVVILSNKSLGIHGPRLVRLQTPAGGKFYLD